VKPLAFGQYGELEPGLKERKVYTTHLVTAHKSIITGVKALEKL
jgi:hypothetical protein